MKPLPLFILVAAFMLATSAPAYAYLDPGTGSALLQGILGALAALAVALKLYWHRFLRLIGLRKKPEEPKPEQHDSEQSPEGEQDNRG